MAASDAAPDDEDAQPAIIRPAIILVFALTALTGVVYPLATYGFANLLFPHQAGGSLVTSRGEVIGSALIGQNFSNPRYFQGRPSATATDAYNAAASTGSNLGPLNPALREAIETRLTALRAADPAKRDPAPVDLVTASASGLDPDISIAAARFQTPRIARLRGLSSATIERLVEQQASHAQFGVLGAPRVNVLALNMALDRLAPISTAPEPRR